MEDGGAAGAGAAVVATIAGAVYGAGVTDHGGLLAYVIGSAACYAASVAAGLYIAARRRVLDSLVEGPNASIASGSCWPTAPWLGNAFGSPRSSTTSWRTMSA